LILDSAIKRGLAVPLALKTCFLGTDSFQLTSDGLLAGYGRFSQTTNCNGETPEAATREQRVPSQILREA
jgi:hypothetical protein